MKLRPRIASSAGQRSLVALALCVGAACADIDNAADCDKICDRYRQCFNTSYDTSACYNRCQSNGTSSDEARRRVDTCAACINGLSCVGAAFTCGTQCSSVVP